MEPRSVLSPGSKRVQKDDKENANPNIPSNSQLNSRPPPVKPSIQMGEDSQVNDVLRQIRAPVTPLVGNPEQK